MQGDAGDRQAAERTDRSAALGLAIAAHHEAGQQLRRSLRAWLTAGCWPVDVVETVQLLASELVTNAVRHTESRLVRVAAAAEAGVLRVAVADEQPLVAAGALRVRAPRGSDFGGRGLALVEQLADRWGARAWRAARRCGSSSPSHLTRNSVAPGKGAPPRATPFAWCSTSIGPAAPDGGCRRRGSTHRTGPTPPPGAARTVGRCGPSWPATPVPYGRVSRRAKCVRTAPIEHSARQPPSVPLK